MNDNIKIISIYDKEYPDSLRAIHKPPKTLYAIGNVALLKSNCIAIVGSRHCTNYGEKMATIFSKGLSERGVTIVSGMALRYRYSCT